MPTTFSAVLLGNLPIIDTTDGNNTAENAAALVGLSFGTAADPLFNNEVTWSAETLLGGVYDMDGSPTETFSIDGGAPQTFSGTSVYGATVSYLDGSTATVSAVIAQDGAGNTYLMPEFSPNADQAALEAGPIRSISLDSLLGNTFSGLTASREDWEIVTCFTAATKIATSNGLTLIDNLRPGDRIKTLDNGYQPLRWIGQRTVAAQGVFAPVQIEAGALGNRRDLQVSQQHRMLIQDWRAEFFTGHTQALVAAKHLVHMPGISLREGGEVTYFHLLFDQHEIIFAEGCMSESFHPGEMGWQGLESAARDEILSLFPELRKFGLGSYGPVARPVIRPHEAALSVA